MSSRRSEPGRLVTQAPARRGADRRARRGRPCGAEPRRDARQVPRPCRTLPDRRRHRLRRDVLAVPPRGWRDQRRRLPPRAADSRIGRPRGRARGLPRGVADLADRTGIRGAALPLHRRRSAQLPSRRVLRRHVGLHDDGCEPRHRLRRDLEVARDVAPVHPVDRRHRHRRPRNRGPSAAPGWWTPAARVGAAGPRDRPALGADPRDRSPAVGALRRAHRDAHPASREPRLARHRRAHEPVRGGRARVRDDADGRLLDAARLRRVLRSGLAVDPRPVHAPRRRELPPHVPRLRPAAARAGSSARRSSGCTSGSSPSPRSR